MRADLNEKIDFIRTMAMKYADAFVPLDGMFVTATVNGTPCEALSNDGVHPDEAGKKLISDALSTVLFKYIDELK